MEGQLHRAWRKAEDSCQKSSLAAESWQWLEKDIEDE